MKEELLKPTQSQIIISDHISHSQSMRMQNMSSSLAASHMKMLNFSSSLANNDIKDKEQRKKIGKNYLFILVILGIVCFIVVMGFVLAIYCNVRIGLLKKKSLNLDLKWIQLDKFLQ